MLDGIMTESDGVPLAPREDECVIPPMLPYDVVRGLVLNRDPLAEDEIRAYVEAESHGERVLHLEKMRTEYVFSRRYDVWDVHMEGGRWWVITAPTNLYPQDLFPSLDYTLSLHIGVTARVLARQTTDATPTETTLFAGAFRRWEQAHDALDRADEAEEFQAVGNHCRMALLELIGSLVSPAAVPSGTTPPKHDDFTGWLELIVNHLAAGSSAEHVRGYVKAVGRQCWQLVGWLTHAKNATRHDGRLVTDATLNVITTLSAAVAKQTMGIPDRCGQCGSYRVWEVDRVEKDGEFGVALLCEKCGAVGISDAAGNLTNSSEL
jgi:hypothetical protein